jgi:hypothetical protein
VSQETSFPSPGSDSLITPRRVKLFVGVMAVLASVSAYSMVTDPPPGAKPTAEEIDGGATPMLLIIVGMACLYRWFQRARRLRPVPPPELAHLVSRWSELRTLLTTHGVDAAAFARRDATASA